jgi:anti-sigma regulatory factor (Ser/Thr protein kinase)
MPLPSAGRPVERFSCAFNARSLRSLRQEVAGICAGTVLGDVARAQFVLAVLEIATNAVRHGGGYGTIDLGYEDGLLWCEIADGGRGIPTPWLTSTRPRPGHIGGWGLWLARHICTSLDVDTSRRGTRIRMCYAVTPDPWVPDP